MIKQSTLIFPSIGRMEKNPTNFDYFLYKNKDYPIKDIDYFFAKQLTKLK